MEIHCWHLLLFLSLVYWLDGKDFEGDSVPAVVSSVSASDIFHSGNSLGQLKGMFQMNCIGQSFCCIDHFYFLKKSGNPQTKHLLQYSKLTACFTGVCFIKMKWCFFTKYLKNKLEMQRDPASPTSMETFIPYSNVVQSILPIFKMYSDLCKCQATTFHHRKLNFITRLLRLLILPRIR